VYESIRTIVTAFVLPPGGPLVLVALGLLAWRRWPRFGRGLAAAGAAALWLCSLPIVANGLVTALAGAGAVDIAAARRADAIVILGGGVRSQALEYGGDTLGRLTLERVRYGAYLARETGLPVLVTGGAPEPGVRAEADLMREALEREYRLPVRWSDERARNTRENAANAARLLKAENKRRIVLVMHGFDVRRALAQFEAAGLQVTPAPTHVPTWESIELADFLPNVGALLSSHYALYEALALARDAAQCLAGDRTPCPWLPWSASTRGPGSR
jgi:uncharacterized SAM-binding protein YcdF (DUF218 family)